MRAMDREKPSDLQSLIDGPFLGRGAVKKASGRSSPVPRGHVLPPGSGPAGETCGSCRHLARVVLAKTYRKCGLNRANWTGGGATDVRARDAACAKWEAKT